MTGWLAPLWLPALCGLVLLALLVLVARDVLRARRDAHRRSENR